MPRSVLLATVLTLLALTAPAAAHPAPFTYLDIHVRPDGLDLSLVAHLFDVAHDVGLDSPERLLDDATLQEYGPRFAALLADRIRLIVDGQAAKSAAWTIAEPLPERQSVRLVSHVALNAPPGVVELEAHLFPYDTAHQTFVNFQEHERVASQTILDASNRTARYYAGTLAGGLAAFRTVAARSVRHVVSGPEHLVMLVGLLLLGTSWRQLVTIVVAFAGGHLAALTLALFTQIGPPLRLVDPALALAVVYIGTDNLMAAGGRDVRAWMSLALGAIHGFGFAAPLRAMALSRPALLWALAAVSLGIGFTQLGLASVVATIVNTWAARRPLVFRRVVLVGSAAVILIGTGWFVQRVFFPGASFPGLMARL